MIVISLIAVVRDVLLLPGGGPHHVHHHRLQQPPGVQPPAGPRPQPLFRGGLVDRSYLIVDDDVSTSESNMLQLSLEGGIREKV